MHNFWKKHHCALFHCLLCTLQLKIVYFSSISCEKRIKNCAIFFYSLCTFHLKIVYFSLICCFAHHLFLLYFFNFIPVPFSFIKCTKTLYHWQLRPSIMHLHYTIYRFYITELLVTAWLISMGLWNFIYCEYETELRLYCTVLVHSVGEEENWCWWKW